MKAYGGGGRGIAPPVLTPALGGGEWLASHSCCFTLRDWIGDWVNPRASLDIVEKGNNLLPLPRVKPQFLGHPGHCPSLYLLNYPSSEKEAVIA
jgi:hypothetical protein